MSGGDISLDETIAVDDSVVFRELDGETVLLHLETGQYFGLDEIGTRVWMLLRDRQTLNAIAETMLAEYEVAPEQLRTDLLALVSDLSAHGLIQRTRASAP